MIMEERQCWLYYDNNLKQTVRTNACAIGFRFFMAAVFMALFAISPASAQQVAHYSDSWISGKVYTGDSIDYGEDSTNSITVVGAGVTDDSYESDGHTFNINVKLTSPNGRVSQDFGSDYTMWYARTEVELPWDSSDIGQYTVRSKHWSHCPNDPDGYYFISGASNFSLPAGVSFTCFNYERIIRYFVSNGIPSKTVLYSIVNPCDASCKASTATYSYPLSSVGAPNLISAEPYVGVPPYNVCSHVAAVQPTSSCSGCADLNLP